MSPAVGPQGPADGTDPADPPDRAGSLLADLPTDDPVPTDPVPADPDPAPADDAAHPAPAAAGRKPMAWRHLLREMAIVVVGALIVSSLLRAFVGQMFIIPSESMENTLLVGDRVVVQKVTGFERGDVVVFTDPGGWLSLGGGERSVVVRALEFVGFPSANSPGHLIKRVIGMPGDRVVCCDRQHRVTVNGQALDESTYLYTDPDGARVRASDTPFDVTVPTGRVWVMGDHRDMSADSRCHLTDMSLQGAGQGAFVPIDVVVGPAVAVAWPLGRVGGIERPAVFDAVPPAGRPAPDRGVIRPGSQEC